MMWEHHLKGENVSVQMQKQLVSEEEAARYCLQILITIIEYVAWQGLALVDTVRRGETFISHCSYVHVIINS